MRLTSLFQYQKLFEGAADYQAMIDAFPYGQIIPDKPWPDWATKDSMSEAVAKVKFRFQTELNWAKAHLKRYDRIIWWLRYIRFSMYYSNVYKPLYNRGFKNEDGEPVTPQWPKYFDPDSNAVKRKENIQHSDLMHFMAIDYHKIQNHVWSNESPDELYELFREYEGEYEKQEVRRLAPDSSHTVVLQMGEYVWLNLNKAGCTDEGKAGRHCGNMPRSLTKDRILSLRRATKGKQEVCLTFVMEEDGYLGEQKGFANNSPDPKYHPYIIELLKQPFIKGMKEGRWASENDFKLSDLSDALFEELFDARPDLYQIDDLVFRYKKDYDRLVKQSLRLPDSKLYPAILKLYSHDHDLGLEQRMIIFNHLVNSSIAIYPMDVLARALSLKHIKPKHYPILKDMLTKCKILGPESVIYYFNTSDLDNDPSIVFFYLEKLRQNGFKIYEADLPYYFTNIKFLASLSKEDCFTVLSAIDEFPKMADPMEFIDGLTDLFTLDELWGYVSDGTFVFNSNLSAAIKVAIKRRDRSEPENT